MLLQQIKHKMYINIFWDYGKKYVIFFDHEGGQFVYSYFESILFVSFIFSLVMI
jgi:hypothetical protein